MPKYSSAPGVFSDIMVRTSRLRSLSRVGGIVTTEEQEKLVKVDKQLQELTKQAIRRLREQDYPFTQIAEEMCISMNDVLELGDYDPKTIKPR